MKQISIAFILLTVVLAACSNKNNKNGHEGHNMNSTTTESTQPAAEAEQNIPAVAVTFKDVDASVSTVINEVVDHYLHIKNALANDNAEEAADAAAAMEKAVAKIDKSLFTIEQKKVYDEVGDELKEHAEHIAKKGDDIKHQRSHFASLSEDVYTLVKAFGAGRSVYHDHCPMARDNKGAMWISELKEVKNPYFGASMLTCGSVEEVIN
ncbi:DUF3347 domain-containing protein [Lacibacter luteus]|uniref:DUF3347 domain-containing protein n=1 Tax=Lacibacter luteus TaxID=2508719 RepID=A0A4Q1CN29_9BACT|nr:DUF3347 domain-containing protein [Lacibacter luteus]RXK62204.1 DUF3347 domain-containing protein [Lacibacter luteus]